MSTPTQVPFPMPDVLVRNWKWLVGIGVLLVVMGIFAILAPFLASVAINAWIGVAFLLAGIAQVAQSFGRGGWREALGHLLIGAVYILGALLVIFNPLAGLMAFSLVIVIMLAQLLVPTGRRPRPRHHCPLMRSWTPCLAVWSTTTYSRIRRLMLCV